MYNVHITLLTKYVMVLAFLLLVELKPCDGIDLPLFGWFKTMWWYWSFSKWLLIWWGITIWLTWTWWCFILWLVDDMSLLDWLTFDDVSMPHLSTMSDTWLWVINITNCPLTLTNFVVRSLIYTFNLYIFMVEYLLFLTSTYSVSSLLDF